MGKSIRVQILIQKHRNGKIKKRITERKIMSEADKILIKFLKSTKMDKAKFDGAKSIEARNKAKRELYEGLWNKLRDKWDSSNNDDFYYFGMVEVFDDFFGQKGK